MYLRPHLAVFPANHRLGALAPSVLPLNGPTYRSSELARRRSMTLKSRIALLSLILLAVAGSWAASGQAAESLSPDVRRLQTKRDRINITVPRAEYRTR